jgi:hypothetical protein
MLYCREMRNGSVLAGNPEWKKSNGISKLRWNSAIKIGLEEIWHRQGSGGTHHSLAVGSVDMLQSLVFH